MVFSVEDLAIIRNYCNIPGLDAPTSCRLQKHWDWLPPAAARAISRMK
uniref:MCRS_N domain-containing protein n=1 Tax=Heterorhabditis bacteriophora TaxID=37862 RepID=A0A1I7XTR4_HETBA